MQAQLLEVVREVASNDYPNPWSNILPECLASLAGGGPARVYGSLLVLRKVASAIEWDTQPGQPVQVGRFSLSPSILFLSSLHMRTHCEDVNSSCNAGVFECRAACTGSGNASAPSRTSLRSSSCARACGSQDFLVLCAPDHPDLPHPEPGPGATLAAGAPLTPPFHTTASTPAL